MSVESGDLGGALAAMDPNADPSTAAPAAPPQEPSAAAVPDDPMNGLRVAFDAELRGRAFTSGTVSKYKGYVRKFETFMGANGWDWATLPPSAFTEYLTEREKPASRAQANQALGAWAKVLSQNGIQLPVQTVSRQLLQKVKPKKKEGVAMGEILPSAPASMLPSSTATHQPAPMPAAAAGHPGVPGAPGAVPMAMAGLPGAAPAMPMQQARPMGMGVNTWRIYKRSTAFETSGIAPGQWLLINDFPAHEIPDVELFVRNTLVPRFGPQPGGSDMVYFASALGPNGMQIQHLSKQIPIAAERWGSTAQGAPGAFGGYGPPPGYPQAQPPQQSFIEAFLLKERDKAETQMNELRSEIKKASSGADPMTMMMLMQKLDAMGKPPDASELMMRARAASLGGMPGIGGFAPPGASYDPYNPFGGPMIAPPALPAPADTSSDKLAALAERAMEQNAALHTPKDPIQDLLRMREVMGGQDKSTELMFSLLRDQAKRSDDEAKEMRAEMRQMLASKKGPFESLGDLVTLKKTLVDLGMVKDINDEGSTGGTWVDVVRDLVGNAEEVGKAAAEIKKAFAPTASADDLNAAMRKRVAANNGPTPGARPTVNAAVTSPAQETKQLPEGKANVVEMATKRADKKRAQAEAESAERVQAAAAAAQRSPMPDGVVKALEALWVLTQEGKLAPTDMTVEVETEIIQAVQAMITSLYTSTSEKPRALGVKVLALFKEIDSLGAMRSLVTGLFGALNAAPVVMNNAGFIDGVATPLHHHYPTVHALLNDGVTREPSDWKSVWAERDAAAVAKSDAGTPTAVAAPMVGAPAAPPATEPVPVTPTVTPPVTPAAEVVNFPAKEEGAEAKAVKRKRIDDAERQAEIAAEEEERKKRLEKARAARTKSEGAPVPPLREDAEEEDEEQDGAEEEDEDGDEGEGEGEGEEAEEGEEGESSATAK